MTAAMVAGVVAPVAASAEEKKFSDVPAGQWYTEAINAMAAKGIISGKGDGTFGLGENVTRAQVATFMVKAKEIKVDDNAKPSFTDVAENNMYKKFIAAAEANKIMSGIGGGNFGPDKELTRVEMAQILVNAYGFKADENNKKSFDDIKDLTWGTAAIETLASLEIVKGDGKNFNPHGVVTREQAAQFIYNAMNYKAPTPEVKQPKVESVKAINATQVEVKFTVEVDTTEAEKVANYAVNSTNPTKVKLGTDKKTAVLTFANANQVQVTNGVLTVDPIATAADKSKKTEKFVQVFSYKDEVAPTVASVEAKTNGSVAKSLTVKATEPIQSGLVKVNGSYVTANFNNTDTAEITGLSLETGKTHTIELVNLTDMAGNKTVSTSATFTVSVDTALPTATLTAKGDKEILVTFNKSMDTASVISALGNGAVKNEALANVETGTPTVVADTNDTQFVIPVTEANIYKDKANRTFTVVLPNTVKDKLGNKLTATTQAVALVKDTAKPVATGYNVVKDNDGKVKEIEVNFSEGLAAGTPAVPSIVNENGVAVASFLGGLTVQPVKAGDKKVVYKATTPAKLSGKFAFSFAKDLVTDQAETPNKSDAFNYTIDFGAGASTFELKTATATGNVITVDFDKAVKGGAVANSATDLNNYSLAGKPLPAGTTIVLNPAQTVATITLPAEESVEKTDAAAVFTVTNVQAVSGEVVKSYTGTVSVVDNFKPVLQSAKVLDNKTIELTYSENIKLSAIDALVGDEFKVLEGSNELTLADNELKANAVSGFANKVRITVAKGTDVAGTPAKDATATKGGAEAAKVTVEDAKKASKDATYNYTVEDNAGKLEVKDASGKVTDLDASGNGTFVVDGVKLTLADAKAGDVFTLTTTAPVAEVKPQSATTLDLTKEIAVETKSATTVDLRDVQGNAHKAKVKVSVAK